LNILLTAINAKYIHSNLAVYSLKASAGKYEPLVQLAEFTINNQPDEIFHAVCRKKPDLLFLSCYIWNRSMLVELAENIHKVRPETIIWAGGPEVSYDAEAFLREYPQFTGVMRGEGEHSFPRLLGYYVDGEGKLEDIPGITYRTGKLADLPGRTDCESELAVNADSESRTEEFLAEPDPESQTAGYEDIVSTGPAVMLKTLDDLPFVYQIPEDFENRIIYYESSRGCPYSCSYCLSSIDKRVRFRNTELVKKELGFLLEHRVPQVKFVDRTFNCNHRHAMEIWQFIQEHDNGVTNFHFEIAADIITDEEIELLSRMRPGLVQLEIGVQTVNEQALEAIHRMAKFERIADRVQRIAAGRNIHQHLDLIAGLPYEDFESFQHSFDLVYAQRPQELQLGFLKVLRGSEMHRRAQEYGIVYRSTPPYEVLATRWITCDELLRLKEVEEMLEVYYNSQQFRYTIEALEKQFSRPFALYAALADYYKEHDLEGKSYSRMQRFLILRDFIRETCTSRCAEPDRGVDKNREIHEVCGQTGDTVQGQKPDVHGQKDAEELRETLEFFDELLTLDFYLRENAKSRPTWAYDPSLYRTETAQFFQREEQNGRYLPDHAGMNWKQTMRMTHLEHFAYDVLGTGKKRETWLLFDYGRRDPLTNDAAVCEVEISLW
jgi:radical SAM superfamily enzyme YgiQ (UPF0313 family)